MPLTDVDKELLQRLLAKKSGAWNDFVDRYLSLIYHAIHHTAHLRSARLTPEDVEDIAAEVLIQLVNNDYKALKEFKGSAALLDGRLFKPDMESLFVARREDV